MEFSELSKEAQATIKNLDRIRGFEVKSLVQREELGAKFSFEPAVLPAQKLIDLLGKLPPESIQEFPKQQLDEIIGQSSNVYNLFSQILDFDPEQADASATRTRLLADLQDQYQPVFTKIYPMVSFAMARTVDFNRLSADGRAVVQSVKDQTQEVMEKLETTSATADQVLQDVRDAAAEQGVTQQAIYFENEAKIHEASSGKWMRATVFMAFAVVAYAIFTLFINNIEVFKMDSIPQALQVATSKFLVFGVLVYILFLCVRSYNSHRHNAVVNKHRQNALMTYTTLAEAGNSAEARDAVLLHAAAAIYAPADSGYVKSEERGYSSGMPSIGLTTKLPGGSSVLGE